MDANGLRFWMLAEDPHWHRSDPSVVHYDLERRSLRLVSQRDLPSHPDSLTAAQSALERIPGSIDQFGTRAYWDSEFGRIAATGAVPGEVTIFVPASTETPTDLAIGYDGVLYVSIAGQIAMQDRRDRWDPVTLAKPGFSAWRMAADPSGGIWVLDRINRKLARVRGLPLPKRPYGPYSSSTFRPCEESPDPPRLIPFTAAVWPAEEMPIAIACSPEGRLALLTWDSDGDARVRYLQPHGMFGIPSILKDARHPYRLTWVTSTRIAVLISGRNEAPTYPAMETPGSVRPVGDVYPLRNHDGGSFLHGVTLPPHYRTHAGSAALHRLSLPSFARHGEASNVTLIDSGNPQSIWHRLYLEAVIPPHCHVTVRLAASNEPAAPLDPEVWYEHRLGQRDDNHKSANIPNAAWVRLPSELPYHAGMLHCPPEQNRSGLFTVLIQRSTRQVKTLRGRFLWVRVELFGDGRATPEIAALRAYASRFSYLEHYLPSLYRETVFGIDADQPGPSTPADFLERFLDNFESVLTPLEDRIAHSYLLTDPRTVPEEALEWLGSWIGLTFDQARDENRRRQLLQAAPELYRWRGTLRGLALALNIATDGAIQGGEIVILEDFRLRRTFATILGADLADEDDPLLGGIAASGNSYVGDTLFLGDETRKEFLALFSADLQLKDEAEQSAIDELFERLAHRVTILVHQDVEPQDLGLIRRVVESETPAHVLSRVIAASHPFIVGIASLVGVDTYLSRRPPPNPVALGRSRIGLGDLIQGPASLDPRLEAADPNVPRPHLLRPIADAGEKIFTEADTSFMLDASGSRAFENRRIIRNTWSMLE